MTSNALRMPLAEWVYRMRIAGVAREAVNIAFTAALFDITSNADLAELSGHTAGSRTLDKHKGDLVKGGWVLIPPNRGGRGNGANVLPAVAETPVEFTDVSRRNPSKICTALAKQTPANFAPHRTTTPANFADVSPRAIPCAPARIETPSGLLTNLENNNPLGSPTADDLARQAYLDGERIKQGVTTKGARSAQRSKGELDGSKGITFTEDGQVLVLNGARAKLLEAFPKLDIDAVCDRAAPEIAKLNYPSFSDAMTVLRKWARILTGNPAPGAPRARDSEQERFEKLMKHI
jgi:hypothetical protein